MSRRDDLIATARRMFRDGGYHATGIDSILAECGVAKATLYSHFGSKDALTLAVLQAEDRDFHAGLAAAAGELTDPTERLLAIFDFAGEWFRADSFNGCMFVNAAAEFSDADSAIREMVATHKAAVRGRMREELSGLDVADPDALAHQLHLLFEGAIVMAKIDADPSVASVAREAARRLIDAPPAGSSKARLLVRSLMQAGEQLE